MSVNLNLRRSLVAAFAAALLLSCLPCRGQDAASGFCSGLYNSPKGFGLVAQFPSEEGFRSLRLYADIYGLPSGGCDRPGAVLGYSINRILSTVRKAECDISFYMGPGVSAGYLKDFDLSHNQGAVLALSGSLGWIFAFRGSIYLDFSWTLEAGMHLRAAEDGGGLRLSLYKNGIYRSIIPQLCLIKRF